MAAAEVLDVVVVGCGISGISAGHYLKEKCPEYRFKILERRNEVGGTWSLFQYPGIRSDSDMYTFGFSFRPWMDKKIISPGADIMKYLQDTVTAEQLEDHIQLNTHVTTASWSTEKQRWSLEATVNPLGIETKTIRLESQFLFLTTGYYSYDKPYTPHITGLASFKGPVVHPQLWKPKHTTACVKKHVVVIGSGATAATLVPNLIAEGASHVTMLQRTPTYMVSRPSDDYPVSASIRRGLLAISPKLAHAVFRTKHTVDQRLGYVFSKRFPRRIKAMLMQEIKKQVPVDFDVDTHFNPPYNPWDQRICLIPDGDMFKHISSGAVSIVTDQITEVQPSGVMLASGKQIQCDVLVTATGLNIQDTWPMSDMVVTVDGRPYDASTSLVYKGFMISDMPNLFFTMGYTNASWTLKADLISERVCSVILHMAAHRHGSVVPRADGVKPDLNYTPLKSGYFARARDRMPKQGHSFPWTAPQNYLFDLWQHYTAQIDDGVLEFSPSRIDRAAAPMKSHL